MLYLNDRMPPTYAKFACQIEHGVICKLGTFQCTFVKQAVVAKPTTCTKDYILQQVDHTEITLKCFW